MPLIPNTWLDAQTVNATTANFQFDANIAQLANGNILVTWTTNADTGAGSPVGFDILAQIFDPMGAKVGTEFIINAASTADNERQGDIVALPGGGFIVIYKDYDIDNLGGSNIRLEEFDASGAQVSEAATVINDALSPALPNYNNPRGAASSDTSVMIVYDKVEASITGVFAKIYDPSTNTYGAEFAVLTGNQTHNADIDVLTNGNYVIVANTNTTDDRLVYRIMTAAGVSVTGAAFVGTTNINGENDREASVTALIGGGFVITWTNTDTSDTDIYFTVYNSAGTQTSSGTFGTVSAANDNNQPVVTGLSDGSFVIVFDNDALNVATASHVSAAGVVLGEFNFDGAITQLAITDLADGRFAVTYQGPDTEIKMEILDTRDSVNPSGVYTPDNWQVGTTGNDIFLAPDTIEIVHGHTGNDNITENAAGASSFYGDAGDDRINVVSTIGSDAYFGGTGTDTIDWSGDTGNAGAVFNLSLGIAVGTSSTEVMQGFENLLGTEQNDIIIGTTGANFLSGNGGDDAINGGLGSDTMVGGIGNDTFFVNTAADVVLEFGGQGSNDRVVASSNYVLAAGMGIERLLAYGPAGTTAINLTGNALSQFISGNAGANILSTGGGAADTMTGLGGNDVYRVFNAADIIVEGVGGGIDRVAAAVTFILAADDNIEVLATNGVVGLNAINLRGNALAQTVQGNNGANQLNGLLGSDTLTGNLGADTFVFNSALGPTNVDKITDYNVAADHFLLENAVFVGLAAGVLAATAFSSSITGIATDATDRIMYETDTGFLWFDRDGNGGAFARVLFADLAGGLVITASEFNVV